MNENMTSVTVVFNVALPEKEAKEFVKEALWYADTEMDHNCEIREYYIVESCDITGGLKDG